MSFIFRFPVNRSLLLSTMHLSRINIITKNSSVINYKIQKKTSFKSKINLMKRIRNFEIIVENSGRIPLKEMEKALVLLKLTGSISPSETLSIIKCCALINQEESFSERNKIINDFWNTFKKLETVTSINHYNALLKLYVDKEYPFSPCNFLREIKSKGLEPNETTYKLLIIEYCRDGNITGATEILEQMKIRNMHIDIAIFDALIFGHAQANDIKSAENILSIMKQGGFDPSASTYVSLICGYIKAGLLNEADELIEKCIMLKYNFYYMHYLPILYFYAIYGYNDKIDKILSFIVRQPGYNEEVLKYIYKLFNLNKLDIAFKLLKTMVRPTLRNGTPLPLGTFFLNYLVKINASEEDIVKYCIELIESDLNAKALNFIVDSFINSGKDEKAFKCLEKAKEIGITLKCSDFWPILTGAVTKTINYDLLNILKMMYIQFDCAPNDIQTLCYYVLPYIVGQDTNVENLWKVLKSYGISFPVFISSLVIYLLNKCEIQKAANIASRYNVYYPYRFIRKSLITSYITTRDISSFIIILKQFVKTHQFSSVLKDLQEKQINVSGTKCLGEIIVEIIKLLKVNSDCKKDIPILLQALVDNNLLIDTENGNLIRNILREKYTLEISTLLEKLTV